MRFVFFGLIASACAPRPETPASIDTDPPGSDCPWVADGCDSNDGCPEKPDSRENVKVTEGDRIASTEAAAACGRSTPSAKLFAEVARELHDKSTLTKLTIVSPSLACGTSVVAELQKREVAGERLAIVVKPSEHFVNFEVAAWNGSACPPLLPSGHSR